MRGPASSTTAEIYIQAHERLKYLQHYTLRKFGNILLMRLILFLRAHLENFFHHINNLHQNTTFTMA